MRLAVMSHGLLFYLWKTIWPFNLCPIYGLPALSTLHHWPFTGYIAAVILISVLAIQLYRSHPAFSLAWAWYVIALAPVSGLFQSGGQLTADRYSYLPSLGIAFFVGGIFLKRLKPAVTVGMPILIVALAILSFKQTQIWHDTLSFWSYVLYQNPKSTSARNNIGASLAERGRYAEAASLFREVLEIDPGHPGAQRNLQRAEKLLAEKAHAR
jgi:tetratricopeptide (TPR) repeat protein